MRVKWYSKRILHGLFYQYTTQKLGKNTVYSNKYSTGLQDELHPDCDGLISHDLAKTHIYYTPIMRHIGERTMLHIHNNIIYKNLAQQDGDELGYEDQ